MRMAPFHVKRKFWWELLFISVLIFLLAGSLSQKTHDVVAMVQPVLVPPVALGVVVTPLPSALAMK
jgi:hypothetical protein